MGFKNLDQQSSSRSDTPSFDSANNVSLSSNSSNELSTSLASTASSDFSLPAMGHSLNTSSLSAYSADLPSFIAPELSSKVSRRLSRLHAKLQNDSFDKILAPLLGIGWSTGANKRHSVLYFTPKYSDKKKGVAKKNHFTSEQKEDMLLVVASSDKFYKAVFPNDEENEEGNSEDDELVYDEPEPLAEPPHSATKTKRSSKSKSPAPNPSRHSTRASSSSSHSTPKTKSRNLPLQTPTSANSTSTVHSEDSVYMLSFSDAWKLMQKIGCKYGTYGYLPPGINPKTKILDVNCFTNNTGMAWYLHENGLLETDSVRDTLAPGDLRQLEEFCASEAAIWKEKSIVNSAGVRSRKERKPSTGTSPMFVSEEIKRNLAMKKEAEERKQQQLMKELAEQKVAKEKLRVAREKQRLEREAKAEARRGEKEVRDCVAQVVPV